MGKTVIIMELINNIAKQARRLLGLRRRGRAYPRRQRPLARDESQALLIRETMESKAALVYGQMNEPPGARLRVALSALSVAEYFRDEEARTAALHRQYFPLHPGRLGGLRLVGRMPSAVGYQPTLATEMGELQERITSTNKGSITSVQAIYVPADDLTDPAPATAFLTWTRPPC